MIYTVLFMCCVGNFRWNPLKCDLIYSFPLILVLRYLKNNFHFHEWHYFNHALFYVLIDLNKRLHISINHGDLNVIQSNLYIRTPASSVFRSIKTGLNSSRENLKGSFWRCEQRPPVNKGHFCNSPWLTLVDRLYLYG